MLRRGLGLESVRIVDDQPVFEQLVAGKGHAVEQCDDRRQRGIRQFSGWCRGFASLRRAAEGDRALPDRAEEPDIVAADQADVAILAEQR